MKMEQWIRAIAVAFSFNLQRIGLFPSPLLVFLYRLCTNQSPAVCLYKRVFNGKYPGKTGCGREVLINKSISEIGSGKTVGRSRIVRFYLLEGFRHAVLGYFFIPAEDHSAYNGYRIVFYFFC